MKFSKKSRYGITALIDLSVYSKSGHVALNSIAQRNGISVQYLEQVFGSLRRAGIIRSVKGPQGGYLLSESPEHITAASIIEALEGSYYLPDEILSGEFSGNTAAYAIQHRIVDEVNRHLDEVLQNVTLADLEREYMNCRQSDEMMYYI
ncbi:MAG: Rrf2 family transcriptional regulator [Lachnospiraceae bacterium]|nr:Rrf2 family transcriptional regulator [Lachnospiraceae bacterium]